MSHSLKVLYMHTFFLNLPHILSQWHKGIDVLDCILMHCTHSDRPFVSGQRQAYTAIQKRTATEKYIEVQVPAMNTVPLPAVTTALEKTYSTFLFTPNHNYAGFYITCTANLALYATGSLQHALGSVPGIFHVFLHCW